MECRFSDNSDREAGMITFDGKVVHGSTLFRYLGSIIQKDGELDGDVAHRIKEGWLKWKSATEVLCDLGMPQRLKGKFYRTAIRPALLYGTECWAVKQCHVQKMNVAEMRMLRWMCGHTKKDRLRNEVIREKVRVASMEDKMMKNRLRWFGHVRRRPVDAPVRRLESWGTSNIVKGRGRPKKTWIKLIENDMRFLGIGESMAMERQGDPRFVWNRNLLEELIENKTGEMKLKNSAGVIKLLSRRCTRRLGTRMWRRGANLEGDTANFIETEQLLEYEDHIFSFLQSKVVERHFNDLLKRYGRCIAVDLTDKHGDEGFLSTAYAEEIQKLTHVRYVSFDFHQSCGNGNFDNIHLLYKEIAEDFEKQGYFLLDPEGKIQAEQDGIIRSNCIDCLDRTNVTQLPCSEIFRFSAAELVHFLQLNVFRRLVKILKLLRNVWVEHGDEISLEYSGTHALKRDLVR
ncbi:hypothetical protein OROHE_013384 [Orobanche hederae]